MKKLLSLFALLMTIVIGAKADYKDLSFTATKSVAAGGEIWYPTSDNVETANTAGWCSKNGNGSNNKYGDVTPNLEGDVVEETPFKIDGVLVKGGNIPTNLTTSKKALVVKFTNATSVTIYGATTSGTSTDNAAVRISIYNVTDGAAVVSNQMSDYASPNHTAYTTVSSLDADKTYIFCIDGGFKNNSTTNQDVVLYAVKFTAPSVEAAPGTPTLTVDGGNVDGGSTTTIASENALKIYYAWTESAEAPAKGDDAYTEQTGASYEFTIPNVTAEMYLHAYGWNSYNEGSTSDIKSAQFNVTKQSTAAKTYNFYTDFSDEVKTALETNFTYDEGNARYKSSADLAANTEVDLGEYAAPIWSGLFFSRTQNLTAGNIRIKENGYIQGNGGNVSYKIKDMYDGDVVKVRCTSASASDNRSFTVTGATEASVTAYKSSLGFTEFTITKSGSGDLTLTQGNGINVWTIAINEDLPAIANQEISTSEGVATFVSSTYALDFTGLATKAYIVTEVNSNVAVTEEVGVVPANTPLLIKGAAVSVPVVATDGQALASTNLLKAAPNGGKAGDGSTIYAYSKSAKQFRKVASTVTIPAGKCYLEISGNSGDAIDIDFDGATAVKAIAEANEANAEAPVKVIKNGKLYIGNYNVAGQLVK